ncbi:butyrophilin subfamily 1 member A1-like [Hypomesus transpacificus]|uniref:butyrophilin subfamily 1 member A1-like n=1 Tax=Hypomesus transpacificus TaxID=137520 RepID=UPI001F085715|nr:butyrophilin subfamily 1 member A1-like [Hypomesus transpacificus]
MGPLIQDVRFQTILVLLTCLPVPNNAAFNLVVPSEPVIGFEGDDIILPCRLSPQNSAAHMRVTWFRQGQFDSPLYGIDNGRVTVRQDYLGRVNMSTQGLEKGDVSLGLKGVLLADRGEYRCQVFYQDWIKEQVVNVQIKRRGSVPKISIATRNKTFIQLSCSSEFWYPEPHMLWLDHLGKEVTSAQTEEARQSRDLFSISSRVKLGKERLQGISCVAMSHDRKSRLESAMKVTEGFYLGSVEDRGYVYASLIPFFLTLVSISASTVYTLFQGQHVKKRLNSLDDTQTEIDKAEKERRDYFNSIKKNEELFEITGKIPDSVWNLMVECAEEVTFDPDTAHNCLHVSEEHTSIKCGQVGTGQCTNQRFGKVQCVLGRTGYASGRHYWAVDLGNNSQWSVGVAQDPENRGSDISIRPDNGYWSICVKGGMLQTVEESPTVLPSELTPATLGVFLDIESQRVTFFNVKKRCHIHSFSFSERSTKELFPFFGPLTGCKEELRITPTHSSLE